MQKCTSVAGFGFDPGRIQSLPGGPMLKIPEHPPPSHPVEPLVADPDGPPAPPDLPPLTRQRPSPQEVRRVRLRPAAR